MIMSSDMNPYLASLEDFVLNQDKLVTYKWLSKKLNIHANTAKQLLCTFSNSADENLLVTYLIHGSTKDGLMYYLVSESDVHKVKSSLDIVIAEHVYSVQKACSPLSSTDLYLADSDPSLQSSDNKLSSISSRKVEERKFKIVAPEKPVDKTKPETSCKTKPETSCKTQQNASVNKPSLFFGKTFNEDKKKEGKEDEMSVAPRMQKENVAASKSPVKSKILSPTKNNKKKVNQSKDGIISAFFNRQAEKKKNEPSPKETKHENKIDEIHKDVEKDAPKEEDKECISSSDKSIQKSVVKTPVTQKKKPIKSSKKKRKNNQDDDDTPARKRKRIVLASDSESEVDEEEEDVNMEEEPEYQPAQELPESEEEDEVIPPTPFGEKNKKRIRKQIDRNYTDDDGFVCTKKEYVYVSCSDDETETNQAEALGDSTPNKSTTPKDESSFQAMKENHSKNKEQKEKVNLKGDTKSEETKAATRKTTLKGKKRSPVKSPKKNSPPKINKQASIMLFFKKKDTN